MRKYDKDFKEEAVKLSDEIGVHTMCRVVKVSESGYYRSLQSAGKPKPWQLLLVKIREIYNENPDNDNYGVV